MKPSAPGAFAGDVGRTRVVAARRAVSGCAPVTVEEAEAVSAARTTSGGRRHLCSVFMENPV